MRATDGIGINLPFGVVASLDVLGRPCHEQAGAIHDALVADYPPKFVGSSAACPLKQVGVTVPIGKIAKLPNTSILFIDRDFNLSENIIHPTACVRTFLIH